MSLIALLGCAEGGLTWAENWEMLALTDDGALIDVRFTQNNSGLWAGAGRVRGAIAASGEGSVLFGVDGMPDNVEALQRGMRIGSDQLTESGGVWTLSLHEGDSLEGYRDLRLTLGEGHGRVDPVDMGRWQVEVPEVLGKLQGYSRVGERDRLIEGQAVLLHHWGEQPPSFREATRMTAVVLGPDLSIGVEQVGSQLIAWAIVDGQTLSTQDAALHIGQESQVQLDFRPAVDLAVQIAPRRPRTRSEPYEHLTGPEQLAVDAWMGLPSRRVSRGDAIGVYQGKPLSASALLLWSDTGEAEDPEGG